MELKDLYYRPVDRDYERVIKADTTNEDKLKQELDEYVVTDELQRYFGRFFKNYADSIDNPTDDVGAWISGFFGSGKSHFLKMLAFLLENREVEGRHAIDYFDAGRKIKDKSIIRNMIKAESMPTDVILFNIDAKADDKTSNSVLNVFNRLFNEMQGFYGANPVIADMEAYLAKNHRFDEFKKKYKDSYGTSWEEARNDFDFNQDDTKDILMEMGILHSEDEARNWCEKASVPGKYKLSIEDFAKKVMKYLDSKGPDHRIVFLLDEVGQYVIQREDRMLNLQSVVEKLGTFCHGRAWVVVTSQQNIEELKEIDKFMDYDFSKIQSRFHTRIPLSSSDAETIIRKRILEKKDEVRPALADLYRQKETVLSNLLQFSAGPEHKLYKDEDDFIATYPMVDYQFQLITESLTAIHNSGSAGKDAASSERTLLDICKQAGEKTMHQGIGTLIPLYVFYDALQDKLEHSVRIVMENARKNDEIGKTPEENAFAVNVLKTLFLIKRVKTMKGSVENITTLMIDSMDVDRQALEDKVRKSLRMLDQQMLVQKDGDVYVFLTDDEQQINKQIDHVEITQADRFSEIGQIIFMNIYKDTRYRYPYLNNRYYFLFSARFNNQDIHRSSYDEVGIQILAADSDLGESKEMLAQRSLENDRDLIAALPQGNDEYQDEIKKALKIRKFFNTAQKSDIPNFSIISQVKQKEASDRLKRAEEYLRDALSEVRMFVRGTEITPHSKDPVTRLNEGMSSLIRNLYNRLRYIETAMTETDIGKTLSDNGETGTLLNAPSEVNDNAQDEVLRFIGDMNDQQKKVTRKAVEDNFKKAPYGYNALDVEWILARLFKREKLNLFVQGEQVAKNAKVAEIEKILVNKAYLEKTTLEKREQVPDKQLKAVKKILSEVFNYSISQPDEDSLKNDFDRESHTVYEKLTNWKLLSESGNYPGLSMIKNGMSLIKEMWGASTPKAFFRKAFELKEDFLDFADDYRKLNQFYAGGYQRNHFDKARETVEKYERNRTYLIGTGLDGLVDQLNVILKSPSPFGAINNLKDVTDQFDQVYNDLLEKSRPSAQKAIEQAESEVLLQLKQKPCYDEKQSFIPGNFKSLKWMAKTSHELVILETISSQAETIRNNLLNQFQEWQADWDRRHKKVTPPTPPQPPVKIKEFPVRKLVQIDAMEIKSEPDIDLLLSALRSKLEKALKENKKFKINF